MQKVATDDGPARRRSKEAGLFPSLLGAAFQRLELLVRDVHDGSSRRLQGTASVTRGRSILARILCTAASLPQTANELPVEVQIIASQQSEQWTRYFGHSRPMRSVLCARQGLLAERIGPAVLTFSLRERDGGVDWALVQLSALGIRLPIRWLTVSAYSGARAGRYTFVVNAALRGIGHIIRYEGQLDVIGPH